VGCSQLHFTSARAHHIGRTTTPTRAATIQSTSRSKSQPSYCAACAGVLHRALNVAQKRGMSGNNPTIAAELPKVIFKEMKILDDHQVRQFLIVAQVHRNIGIKLCSIWQLLLG